MILSSIICVHFDHLSFHILVTPFVLALEREKSGVTPAFLISFFSPRTVMSSPDFPHPQLNPFSLPFPFPPFSPFPPFPPFPLFSPFSPFLSKEG